MSINISTYFLPLTPELYSRFSYQISEFDTYDRAVDEFKHTTNHHFICLVAKSGDEITHIAAGRKVKRAGVGQVTISLFDIEKLTSPSHPGEVMAQTPPNVKNNINQIFNANGVFPKKSGQVVQEVLSQDDQIAAYYLRHRPISDRLKMYNKSELDALALQKDTINLSMLLANFEQRSVNRWSAEGRVDGFLEGLPIRLYREDTIAVLDAGNVPGYDLLKDVDGVVGAIFEDEKGARIKVILANREGLEDQSGADLIYYNEVFRNFVLIQYKMMQGVDGKASFSYPSDQLDKQVATMQHVRTQLQTLQNSQSLDDFRLNEDPFYLKFCPKLDFKPDNKDLIKGMYLPLDYYVRGQDQGAFIGPRGGKTLTYENVRRYMHNTEFSSSVQKAWIGTSEIQSKHIEDYIEQSLAFGNSVTLTIKAK